MKVLMSFVFVLLSVFNLPVSGHPFNYDLHLSSFPGKSSNVMITAHGMGGNYRIAESIKIDKTLLSFNFPDHDLGRRLIAIDQTVYGTIEEILPLLYVIKQCVLVDGHEEVDLYGFSAGGGAIINALAALNTSRFDERLNELGIGKEEKSKMLRAIEKGIIILDTPLKSLEEIIEFRGRSKELDTFAERYQENDMEPIKALKYLQGLSLNIIVHFQNPDEILSNRDDHLFFQQLKMYNAGGATRLIIGRDHGHLVPHFTLWDFYFKEINRPALIN